MEIKRVKKIHPKFHLKMDPHPTQTIGLDSHPCGFFGEDTITPQIGPHWFRTMTQNLLCESEVKISFDPEVI